MKLPHADPTGFFAMLHQVVRMRYGKPGEWGHGKYPHARRKGPGRRRIPLSEQNHPAGTKLVKRFIRDGKGEQTGNRKIYAALTGEQFHERYSS